MACRDVSEESVTFPVECNELKVGNNVIIEGRPCSISKLSSSVSNGQRKIHMTGIDMFKTNMEYMITCLDDQIMEVPVINYASYMLVGICNKGFMDLVPLDTENVADDSVLKDDLFVPDGELGERMRAMWEECGTGSMMKKQMAGKGKEIIVTVAEYQGEEAAVTCAFNSDKEQAKCAHNGCNCETATATVTTKC